MLRRLECPWTSETLVQEYAHGHHTVFEYALSLASRCPDWMVAETMEAAASYGQLHVIRWWLHELRANCSLTERACEKAARSGHVAALEALADGDALWRTTTAAAAALGHLEVLHVAHQRGAPWAEGTARAAAKYGHLHLLQWAEEHGCPCNLQQLEAVATRNDVLAWLRLRHAQ
ncbi:hypothetical protein JKP88DRAFT_156673 [Tribonema minus]|uniref:Ankyrin repeat domain-containing protein n=1 Tax=Tribonema minus TaxID=303371 RepID=A0A836CNN8_9STRA|nr:hypothetical protein JKP88DRAFT_156673 [Tribonema minus]